MRSTIRNSYLAYRENINNDDQLIALLSEVKKIASTYEAYVFLQSRQNDHKAAAFVAASAHQLIFQISSVIDNENNSDALNDHYIAPQISASLLYFIAGYTADSSEMISKVSVNNCRNIEVKIIKALQSLLTGQLKYFDANQPDSLLGNEWGEIAASNALWAHIHRGINIL
ncbi:hypothetical protein [Grimontia marina]|uniref:Uncharacterized protein n=1 Tax=Grimontia marina TaxID=646534 RepID=A0A128FK03_9GAMM|nr:hypothetical protein [Grimontia marina]CZF87128.1 hypothetical protein GMA8713_05175 [Grimontia marina]